MRKLVHIRRCKGHKDRFVPLPDLTLKALRALWLKHRHPNLLLPNPTGSAQCIQQATRHMDRGGAQNVMQRCRTPDSGELYAQCTQCDQSHWHPLSCGHRSCPKCQAPMVSKKPRSKNVVLISPWKGVFG